MSRNSKHGSRAAYKDKEIARQLYGVRKPYERMRAKVGRNEPCPCFSGRKFKQCCGGVK